MTMKKLLPVFVVAAILSLTSSVSAGNYVFEKDMSIGSSNVDVAELQTLLINQGFDIPSVSSNATPKGYFGEQTKRAVEKFQASVGVASTGYVGPLTRAKLNNESQEMSFKITSPRGGENWKRGSTETILWNAPAFVRATYGHIILAPVAPACPQGYVCQPNVSYVIAQNISVDQHLYNWRVGDFISNLGGTPPSDGVYTIQMCQNGTSTVCATSRPFTISSNTAIKSPVIDRLDAPVELSVDQLGTWVVHASDPQNTSLSYMVTWGDEPVSLPTLLRTSAANPTPQPFVQTSTFTHSYEKAGMYKIVFTVRNASGLITQTSTTVNVRTSEKPVSVRLTSPNGGEQWVLKSTPQISWVPTNATTTTKLDLYLNTSLCVTTQSDTADVTSPSLTILPPRDCTYRAAILDKNVAVSTIYNWIVGTDIDNKPIPKGNYKIEVCLAGTSKCDQSDDYFSIVDSVQ